MNIPTQNEFLRIVAGGVEGGNLSVKTAKVVDVREGSAVIRFDEDAQPSQKIYKSFVSYNPAIGDRVMLFNGIIIGGWRP